MASELIKNFSFVLPGQLAGSGFPLGQGDDEAGLVQRLRELGIGAVVTLTEDELPAAPLQAAGIEYLHLPIADFHPPTIEQISQFVEFAHARIMAGTAVLAHCYAGIGRTGTLIACYLVARGQDPREAIATLRQARPGSVETYEQEDSVFAYYQARLRDEAPPLEDPGPRDEE